MDPYDLLIDWLIRIRVAQLGHIKSATYFDRLNFWLGIPVVALTTIVGTSVFATLQNESSRSLKIATGVGSVIAAVLAGVQTFLRYSERAEKHRVTSGKYGVLRREVEQNLAFAPSSSDELKEYVDSLRLRWDKLTEDSPTAPKRIWQEAEKDLSAVKSELKNSRSRAQGAA